MGRADSGRGKRARSLRLGESCRWDSCGNNSRKPLKMGTLGGFSFSISKAAGGIHRPASLTLHLKRLGQFFFFFVQ